MKEFFCIFGGGGIRGAAYSGALRALQEAGVKITGLGGSSVGAVVAGLVSAGYSPQGIEEIFENIDFGIFKDINFDFKKGLALSKGGNFYEWMKEKIGAKRFMDLNGELIIFAADIAFSRFYEFSKEKTPDVEIAQAIRASVSMPGLFAPIYEGGECLIDGDLLKSMPLWAACPSINEKYERILEFRLENNEVKKEISNTFDYLNAVYDSLTGFATDYIIKKYENCDRYDFIKINLDNVSVVDFMADKEKKRKMAVRGYSATERYFKSIYPKKARILLEQYEALFKGFDEIFRLIRAKDYNGARFCLAGTVSKIADKKEILDLKLTGKILDFKRNYDKTYVEKSGFLRKKADISDKDGALSNSLLILDELSKKVKYFSSQTPVC